MPADQLITCDHDPTIRTLPDGTGLCTGDCGQPPVCCPSPCGKKWMLCLNSYSYSAEQTISRAVVQRVDEFGNITQMPPGDAVRRFESVNLEGGPFQLFGNDIDDGSPCTTGVSRRVPVRWVRLQDSDPNSAGDFRTEDVACFTAGAFCESGLPIAGNGRPVDVSPSLLGFLQGMRIPNQAAIPQLPDITGAYADTGGSPVVTSSVPASVCRVPGGQGGIPLAAYSLTRSVSRSFVWGPGGCSYDETVVIREPFKTCTCGVTTSPYQCETREGVIVWTYRKSFRLTWKILEDCDGHTSAPCGGVIPTECTGPQLFVEGAACGRVGPSRVYLPVGNVTACGTVSVAAAGGYCYTFKTTGPFRSSVPAGGILGNEIVDQGSPQGCCVCGASQGRCIRALLAAGGCRQNAVRNASGQLVIYPAFINDSGGCCCKGSDLITIQIMSSDVELGDNPRFGIRQRWDLTRGAGTPFRRDDPFPIGNPQTNPDAEPISRYVNLELNDEHDYHWGPSSSENAPPMACEWTFLNFLGINFSRPQFPNIGFWNSANQMDLPCPGDGDARINGFRIENWAYSQTCDSFDFVATWSHEDGGTLRNHLRISIQRPEEPGDPCSGGCTPADANPPVPSTQTGIVFPPGDIGNLIG